MRRPTQRLPLRLRLREPRDFALLKKVGVSKAGKYLVLSVRPVDSLKTFQFGLITGRKIGNAVARNRFRRRLREIVRKHQHHLKSDRHWVVIARWSAPSAEYADLERDWLRLASKLGILLPHASP